MTPSLFLDRDSTATPPHAVTSWLERAAAGLEDGPSDQTVEQLRADLSILRKQLGPDQWSELVRSVRSHRLAELVHQDPFTQHAFRRPRGYPGDAPLLDWIYDGTAHAEVPAPGTLGGRIFAHTSQVPACAAVRWRMTHLADRLGAMEPDSRVLSLACGHLREAGTVLERGGTLPSIDALDQDPLSLAEVRARLDGQPVQTHDAGVRELLTGAFSPESQGYDLVYSAGLYDYLDDSLAARLNTRLVERVRVGGKVVVANFMPGIPDVGYMEVFMDWYLIYRTAAQLEATFGHLDDAVALRSYVGPFRYIVFTEATRMR